MSIPVMQVINLVKVPFFYPPQPPRRALPETLHGDAAVLAKILRRATLPEGPHRPRRATQLAKQMKMEMRAEAEGVEVKFIKTMETNIMILYYYMYIYICGLRSEVQWFGICFSILF